VVEPVVELALEPALEAEAEAEPDVEPEPEPAAGPQPEPEPAAWPAPAEETDHEQHGDLPLEQEPVTSPSHLRPNGASAWATGWIVAARAGDREALSSAFPLHARRRRRLWPRAHAEDGGTDAALDLLLEGGARIDAAIVATLGARQCLAEVRFSWPPAGDAAARSLERLFVCQVDPDGCTGRVESFERDDALRACMSLIEHWTHDELAGAERARADRLRTALAVGGGLVPGEEMTGAERVGVMDWSGEGAGALSRGVGDVLALTERATLWRSRAGGGRSSDGPDALLLALRFGRDGSVDHIEVFPRHDIERAWACFLRLDADPVSAIVEVEPVEVEPVAEDPVEADPLEAEIDRLFDVPHPYDDDGALSDIEERLARLDADDDEIHRQFDASRDVDEEAPGAQLRDVVAVALVVDEDEDDDADAVDHSLRTALDVDHVEDAPLPLPAPKVVEVDDEELDLEQLERALLEIGDTDQDDELGIVPIARVGPDAFAGAWAVADNAAARALRTWSDRLVAGETDVSVLFLAPNHSFSDRRSEPSGVLVGPGATAVSIETIATRGDRVALTRVTVRRDGEATDTLHALGLDGRGRIVDEIALDDGDLDEAFDALDEVLLSVRPDLGDRVASRRELTDALTSGDVERARACFRPDAVVLHHDEPAHDAGVDAWLRRLGGGDGTGVRLDVRDLEQLRGTEWGAVLHRVHRTRTMTGGAVDAEAIVVLITRHGVIDRMETFPVDQRDRALARFEELRPIRRIVAAAMAACAAHDASAFRSWFTDDAVVTDHRSDAGAAASGIDEVLARDGARWVASTGGASVEFARVIADVALFQLVSDCPLWVITVVRDGHIASCDLFHGDRRTAAESRFIEVVGQQSVL
jgi:hypothetical protein